MDAASGWCEGCLRTLDEIAAWGGLDEPAKRAVLLATSARRPRWRAMRRAASPSANESGDDAFTTPTT